MKRLLSNLSKSVWMFLAAWFLVSCSNSTSSGQNQTELSAVDFKSQIEATANPQVIDVRTPEEYNAGYIKDAQNLNIYNANFSQSLDLLNKEDSIFVYCKSGGRSSDAAKQLIAKGFKHVYELDGGMMAWERAKLPVDGGSAVETVKSPGMSVADFDSLVKSQPTIVVDFHAPWCGPCKQMAPYLEKMKEKYPENELKIVKIDVDQNTILSDHFQITGIPLIKIYNQGEEKVSQLGFVSEDKMMSLLKPYLKS